MVTVWDSDSGDVLRADEPESRRHASRDVTGSLAVNQDICSRNESPGFSPDQWPRHRAATCRHRGIRPSDRRPLRLGMNPARERFRGNNIAPDDAKVRQ